MTYLVDANVLSEATKPMPEPRVMTWLAEHEHEFVVDPIVLGELRFGIVLLPPGAKRQRLEEWFNSGVQHLQCLSWEAATAIVWSDLLARLRRKGHAMPIKDSLIAATALQHDLTVVTRNQADFKKAGVRVFDPFAT